MSIKNILIVDDSKTSRVQLSRLLRDYKVEIATAESAEEAIDFLQQSQPDAIFLDHTMPGMDGLQALKIIKQNPGTSLIPIAMYTSNDDEGYADQVRACGAVDILYKPPTPTTLSGVVGKLDEAFLSASANVANLEAAGNDEKANEAALASIEDLVSSTVRVQLAGIVKTRLTPLFEERIEQVGRNLQSNVESSVSAMIDRAVEGQAGRLQGVLAQEFEGQRADFEKIVMSKLQDLRKELNDNVVQYTDESAKRVEQAIYSRLQNQLTLQSERLLSQNYWLTGLAIVLALSSIGLHWVQL